MFHETNYILPVEIRSDASRAPVYENYDNYCGMAELVVVHVVGTPEDIRAGRGESANTYAQAAVRLGVSVTALWQLVAQGELTPCAACGKTKLFRESDVEALGVRLRTTRGAAPG